MSDFEKGDRVRHERYGTGNVLGVCEAGGKAYGSYEPRAKVLWDNPEKDPSRVLTCNLEPTTAFGEMGASA